MIDQGGRVEHPMEAHHSAHLRSVKPKTRRRLSGPTNKNAFCNFPVRTTSLGGEIAAYMVWWKHTHTQTQNIRSLHVLLSIHSMYNTQHFQHASAPSSRWSRNKYRQHNNVLKRPDCMVVDTAIRTIAHEPKVTLQPAWPTVHC